MKNIALTSTGLVAGAVFTALISFLLINESHESAANSVGSTFGKILVDSPEVYTRERMVNDRFRQEAWLMERLQQDPVPNTQGDLSTGSSTKLTAELSTQPSAQPEQAGSMRQSDGSETSDDDQPENAVSQQPQLSAIEAFRSRQAYREEIRNAIIENQLDDRHDLNGNTLYRLKFDATVIPGNDTSAWAEIKVQVGNSRAGDVEEIATTYQRWIEALGEDINGRVRQLALNATTPQQKLDLVTSARAAWDLIYSEFRNENDFEDEFPDLEWSDILRLLRDGDECYDELACLSSVLLVNELSGLSAGFRRSSIANEPGREDELYFDNDYVEFDWEGPAGALSVKPKIITVSDSSTSDYYGFIGGYYLTDGVCRSWRDEEERKPEIVSVTPSRGAVAIDFRVCDPDLAKVIREADQAFLRFETVQDESGATRNNLFVRSGLLAFRDHLESIQPAELYAYAVTPRESTQQISTSSQRVVAEQIRLAASAAVENQGVAIDAGNSSLFSEYARFLDSRPIVVGISSFPMNTSYASSADRVAEFGWLIGPTLVVGSSGLATYRHQASQNSLAVLVSVPAWWRRADIRIETNWLDQDGNVVNEIGEEGSGSERTVSTFEIALPGDTAEITSLMLLDGKRPPPTIQSVEPPVTIMDGERARAEILIAGDNLWRSGTVTIGSLRAIQISVLPNMKGIIAEFWQDELLMIANSENSDTKLRVWTSEGVVERNWEADLRAPD